MRWLMLAMSTKSFRFDRHSSLWSLRTTIVVDANVEKCSSKGPSLPGTDRVSHKDESTKEDHKDESQRSGTERSAPEGREPVEVGTDGDCAGSGMTGCVSGPRKVSQNASLVVSRALLLEDRRADLIPISPRSADGGRLWSIPGSPFDSA